jgi:hypothetical protein
MQLCQDHSYVTMQCVYAAVWEIYQKFESRQFCRAPFGEPTSSQTQNAPQDVCTSIVSQAAKNFDISRTFVGGLGTILTPIHHIHTPKWARNFKSSAISFLVTHKYISIRLWASGLLGTCALGLLGSWANGLLGNWALGPRDNWALGLLGTWALGHLGSWALGLLGTVSWLDI